MTMVTTRQMFAAALLTLTAAIAAAPGAAKEADIDKAFVEKVEAKIKSIWPDLLAGSETQSGALEAVRQLLALRVAAHTELESTTGLKSMKGLETQDRYEAIVVSRLFEVSTKGVEAEKTPPTQEDVVYFAAAMEALPEMGPSPVPFMVLHVAHSTLKTADALAGDPSMKPETTTALALRRIHQATQTFIDSQDGLMNEAVSDDFRQNSVVARLRCPKDDGTYSITNMKNKASLDGSVVTIYHLRCNICYEIIKPQFDHIVLTRVNAVSEKQKLAKETQKVRPDEGLDP